MDVYFAPLACSAASRIAFYEAGVKADFIYVDKAKKTETGEDYLAINPLGLVPTLRRDDGSILSENAAILRYLSEKLFPETDATALQQWLSFINSELHTGAFSAILDPKAPPEVHAYAIEKARGRFAFLDAYLKGRDYLLSDFSLADGYLAVVMNWTQVRGPNLADFPNLTAYRARVMARDAVKRAMGEELALYQAEQKARAA